MSEVLLDPKRARATPARRVVLTGGPGAGKTAVLELARRRVSDLVARARAIGCPVLTYPGQPRTITTASPTRSRASTTFARPKREAQRRNRSV